jgi:hypothetical protein
MLYPTSLARSAVTKWLEQDNARRQGDGQSSTLGGVLHSINERVAHASGASPAGAPGGSHEKTVAHWLQEVQASLVDVPGFHVGVAVPPGVPQVAHFMIKSTDLDGLEPDLHVETVDNSVQAAQRLASPTRRGARQPGRARAASRCRYGHRPPRRRRAALRAALQPRRRRRRGASARASRARANSSGVCTAAAASCALAASSTADCDARRRAPPRCRPALRRRQGAGAGLLPGRHSRESP